MNPFYTTTSDATPMESAVVVTKSDSTDIVPPSGPARPTRGLLIGGAGNVTVNFADGSSVLITIPATACGVVLPLAITRVLSTGTTATLMVAFF